MAELHVEALRSSVARLHSLVAEMDTDDLTRRAYPAQWSIADVLSHLGSGAVITKRRLDDAVADIATPDDLAPSVWEEWNAKSPDAKRDDALAADAELLDGIDAVTPQERSSFTSEMGPMTLDFEQFVAMRLNEHVLHTWDIEVIDDPTSTPPQQPAALVVDNLQLIARFTATPTGDTRTITITTTEPDRGFTVDLSPDAVNFSPTPPEPAADLMLPAEAFVRLVYGRLDPEHTPAGAEGSALAVLRRAFPGP
jgi:uncharacterized protein (TIGR03083 family)